MSDYTISLYWLVKNLNSDKTKSIDQQIDIANSFIFDFDYPIWNESYKATFERKLVNHFLMYEIGQESINLFKQFLKERLNLIMPYYNQIYETTVKDYDYMKNYNFSENQTTNSKQNDTITGNQTGNNTTTGNSITELRGDGNSKTINSDFPQATYNTGVDYASGSSETTDSNSQTNEENNSLISNSSQNVSNNNESNLEANFVNTKTGNTVSLTQLLMEYRSSIINIESDIFNDIKNLFMLVF